MVEIIGTDYVIVSCNAIYALNREGKKVKVDHELQGNQSTQINVVIGKDVVDSERILNKNPEMVRTEIEKADIENATVEKIKSIMWRFNIMKASISILEVFQRSRFKRSMSRFLCSGLSRR